MVSELYIVAQKASFVGGKIKMGLATSFMGIDNILVLAIHPHKD